MLYIIHICLLQPLAKLVLCAQIFFLSFVFLCVSFGFAPVRIYGSPILFVYKYSNKTPVSSYLLYLICIRPLMNRYNIIYTFVSLFGCALPVPRHTTANRFGLPLCADSLLQFNRFIQFKLGIGSRVSRETGKKRVAFYNYSDTQAFEGDGIFV